MTRRQSGHLKGSFLASFRRCGNVTTAARVAGVERSTVYKWQEHDERFAAAFRIAEVEATEYMEQEAYRRAMTGVVRERPLLYKGVQVGSEIIREYSDTLLIVLLKARAPEKYTERSDMRHSGAVSVLVPWGAKEAQEAGGAEA